MSLIIDGVIIIVGIGISKSIVEPFAVSIVDNLLLPNVGSIFERINPNTPNWLRDPNITGEKVGTKLAEILSDEINGFDDRPGFIQRWALERLIEKYDFTKNADVLARQAEIGRSLMGSDKPSNQPSMATSVAQEIAEDLDPDIGEMESALIDMITKVVESKETTKLKDLEPAGPNGEIKYPDSDTTYPIQNSEPVAEIPVSLSGSQPAATVSKPLDGEPFTDPPDIDLEIDPTEEW